MEEYADSSEDDNSETSILPTEDCTPFLEDEMKPK